MIRATIIVSGTVQGVGFRYVVRNSVKPLTITGHVKNLEDQTVEIIVEGSKKDIQSLVQAIRSAKEPVSVKDVNVTYGEATGEFKSFKIIFGDMVEELVEGLSTGHMLLMTSIGKQDQMLDKQDQMLDKQDQTVTEIRNLSTNMHDMMDIRFNRLEGEIRLIKEKIGI